MNDNNTRLTPEFWKKYFLVYDMLKELEPYRELLDSIIYHAEIKKDDFVLDLGAGTCNLEERLKIRPFKLEAIDSSEAGLAICSNKTPWVNTKLGDITKPLPYKNNSFDVIVSSNTLYTIPRTIRPKVIRELNRIIKPGGIIVSVNLTEEFKPFLIYLSAIKSEIMAEGITMTIIHIIRVIPATLKMFYYNAIISRENREGFYDFFRPGEQGEEFLDAGFNVLKEKRIYAHQGELIVVQKK